MAQDETPSPEQLSPPAAAPVVPPVPAELAAPAAEPYDRKAEGAKFTAAFGAKGPGYFADGLTFEEARTAFSNDVLAENKSLKDRLAKLSKQGEDLPVSFDADGDGAAAEGVGPNGTPAEGTRTAYELALGPNLARVAASIKFPARK